MSSKVLGKRRETTERTGSPFAQQKSLRLKVNHSCLRHDVGTHVELCHNGRVATLPSGMTRVKNHLGTIAVNPTTSRPGNNTNSQSGTSSMQ